MKSIVYLTLLPICLAIAFVSCNAAAANNEEPQAESSFDYQFEPNEHIHWNAYSKADEIVLEVYLNKGWMTYSQFNDNLMGPLPTMISFEENANYELVGSVEESLVKMKFDKEANEELAYFENKGVFTQKIKVNSGEKFAIKGNINFMTCNEKGCEPPTDFGFEIEITP